jgi:hypothetical protein
MTASRKRLIGIAFFAAAAIVAILNLKRVAGLGLNYLPVLLMLIGLAFVAQARKESKPQ